MTSNQIELRLDCDRATTKTDRPLVGISLHRLPFGFGVDLASLRRACATKEDSTIYDAILSALRLLCTYRVRKSVDRGRSYAPFSLCLAIQKVIFVDGASRDLIFIPAGQIAQATVAFARFGFLANLPAPGASGPSLEFLSAPFVDGTTLDALQISTMREVLGDGGSRILDYGMGGGKSLLIAAALRANGHLRPALVTGSCSTDTAQLALVLARTLGERVCLLGCTGSLSADTRRSHFVRDPGAATILVGTHGLLKQIDGFETALDLKAESPSSGLLETCADDAQTFAQFDRHVVTATRPRRNGAELASVLSQARIYIADEVDALPTIGNLPHVLGLNIDRMYGFTGTWGRRSDRMDEVFLDLLSTDNRSHAVVRVAHRDIAATGRVVPVALFAYQFSEADYPFSTTDSWRPTASLVHRYVIGHGGRNRFIAELAAHAMTLAAQDRGTAILFAKTIQHGTQILKQLCAVLGIPCTVEALRDQGVLLHNAKLSGRERVANIAAIRSGRIRLCVSTDTLAVGFDCSCVTDIVDATGMQEKRLTLQRSGRPVRQGEGKVQARFHFVLDAHHPALAKISDRKRRTLEHYFGRSAAVFPSNRLPWRSPLIERLSDSVIAEELGKCRAH